jgi:hypothetical protein
MKFFGGFELSSRCFEEEKKRKQQPGPFLQWDSNPLQAEILVRKPIQSIPDLPTNQPNPNLTVSKQQLTRKNPQI